MKKLYLRILICLLGLVTICLFEFKITNVNATDIIYINTSDDGPYNVNSDSKIIIHDDADVSIVDLNFTSPNNYVYSLEKLTFDHTGLIQIFDCEIGEVIERSYNRQLSFPGVKDRTYIISVVVLDYIELQISTPDPYLVELNNSNEIVANTPENLTSDIYPDYSIDSEFYKHINKFYNYDSIEQIDGTDFIVDFKGVTLDDNNPNYFVPETTTLHYGKQLYKGQEKIFDAVQLEDNSGNIIGTRYMTITTYYYKYSYVPEVIEPEFRPYQNIIKYMVVKDLNNISFESMDLNRDTFKLDTNASVANITGVGVEIIKNKVYIYNFIDRCHNSEDDYLYDSTQYINKSANNWDWQNLMVEHLFRKNDNYIYDETLIPYEYDFTKLYIKNLNVAISNEGIYSPGMGETVLYNEYDLFYGVHSGYYNYYDKPYVLARDWEHKNDENFQFIEAQLLNEFRSYASIPSYMIGQVIGDVVELSIPYPVINDLLKFVVKEKTTAIINYAIDELYSKPKIDNIMKDYMDLFGPQSQIVPITIDDNNNEDQLIINDYIVAFNLLFNEVETIDETKTIIPSYVVHALPISSGSFAIDPVIIRSYEHPLNRISWQIQYDVASISNYDHNETDDIEFNTYYQDQIFRGNCKYSNIGFEIMDEISFDSNGEYHEDSIINGYNVNYLRMIFEKDKEGLPIQVEIINESDLDLLMTLYDNEKNSVDQLIVPGGNSNQTYDYNFTLENLFSDENNNYYLSFENLNPTCDIYQCNYIEYSVSIKLDDNIPPKFDFSNIINLDSVEYVDGDKIYLIKGASIPLPNVSDNFDNNYEIDITHTYVNTDLEGENEIHYCATDKSGNENCVTKYIIITDGYNSFDTAYHIESQNASISGNLVYKKDVDYYKFTITEDSIVNIQLLYNTISNEFKFAIFDDNEHVISGVNIEIDNGVYLKELLTPGDYYILIYPELGTDVSPYNSYNLDLIIEEDINIFDAYEFNDTLQSASYLTIDKNLNIEGVEHRLDIFGTIHEISDRDFYKINIPSKLKLTLKLPELHPGNEHYDYNLILYNSLGEVVASSTKVPNVDLPGIASEYIQLVLNPGTYYIEVYSVIGFDVLNSYNLILEFEVLEIISNNIIIQPSDYGFPCQYHFYELEKIVELSNDFSFNTNRLRTGYIQSFVNNQPDKKYLVLSPRREGAGLAFLHYQFETPIKAIGFDISLWSSKEYLDPTTDSIRFEFRDSDGHWHLVQEFIDYNLSTNKELPNDYYYIFEESVYEIRFVVESSAIGSKNKGRVVLGDLNISY